MRQPRYASYSPRYAYARQQPAYGYGGYDAYDNYNYRPAYSVPYQYGGNYPGYAGYNDLGGGLLSGGGLSSLLIAMLPILLQTGAGDSLGLGSGLLGAGTIGGLASAAPGYGYSNVPYGYQGAPYAYAEPSYGYSQPYSNPAYGYAQAGYAQPAYGYDQPYEPVSYGYQGYGAPYGYQDQYAMGSRSYDYLDFGQNNARDILSGDTGSIGQIAALVLASGFLGGGSGLGGGLFS